MGLLGAPSHGGNDLAAAVKDALTATAVSFMPAGMKAWTQSKGIPNLFMLPKKKKKDSSNPKIGFGDNNEDDEGPCPERLSAMVRFIHRKMQGESKFNEDVFCKRADLIQGVSGFFAKKVPALNGKTWLEEIRGTVRSWGH